MNSEPRKLLSKHRHSVNPPEHTVNDESFGTTSSDGRGETSKSTSEGLDVARSRGRGGSSRCSSGRGGGDSGGGSNGSGSGSTGLSSTSRGNRDRASSGPGDGVALVIDGLDVTEVLEQE